MRLPFAWALAAALLVWLSTAEAAPACEPKPIGTGTYSQTQDTPAGTWSVHFCPSPFTWTPVYTLKRRDFALTYPSPASAAGMTALQLYRWLWETNVSLPQTDPSLAELYAPAKAWAAVNAPPDPRWVVRANGTSATRPSYLIASPTKIGARVTGGDAPVGLDCWCVDSATRVVSGSSTYCPWITGQTPVTVTLCARAP